MNSELLNKMNLPEDLRAALSACPNIWFPKTRQELYELCFGTSGGSVQIVGYTIPGLGYVQEAEVVRCKNGASVNFTDEYMRRRDPDCMYIGDDFPTDKPRFKDSWGMEFGGLRAATMSWFAEQSLIEKKPSYALLTPPTFPLTANGSRKMVVIIWLFLGFVFGSLWILYGRKYLRWTKDFAHELRRKES